MENGGHMREEGLLDGPLTADTETSLRTSARREERAVDGKGLRA